MRKDTMGTALLAAIAALTLASSPADAQAAKPQPKHETHAQLQKEAKITLAAAKKTALEQVPGGKVKSGELEREGGKLLYSFDIKSKGKAGIDEVQIDALTGAVLSNKHETAAEEKAEAKAEKKEHGEHKGEYKKP